MNSRMHVQKARRKCKATTYSTVPPETSLPSTDDGAGSYSHGTDFTGQFQLLNCDLNSTEVSSEEENNAALQPSASYDIMRSAETTHLWHNRRYGLSGDLTSEIPSPILSHVYLSSLPCANSVLLSHRDRLYLEYFSTSSLVKVLGKTYTWSHFRYICGTKASEEAMVMYAVMALSASELHQRFGYLIAHGEGLLYHSLSLQRITDTISSLSCISTNIEAVLSALFLVIVYEWRFGSSISHLQDHSKCVLLCLNAFFQVAEGQSSPPIDLTTCPSFTPFCAQILLWIL